VLDPQDRSLLLASLRPPDGYVLDRAIATTYTLDLLALLAVPLAFTTFDYEDAEGRPTTEPLALLQALRTSARRLVVFCQAGRIQIPRAQRLVAYLEDQVFEVTPPAEGGSFHPKLWLVRYVLPSMRDADRPDDLEAVRYRLLCLSRNLTFDRSWDTALVLDGKVATRDRAYNRNAPLQSFISALPGMSVRPVPDGVTADVARLTEEVGRVNWDYPEGFTDLAFWPLGLPGSREPFNTRFRRLLVVSPFLADAFLERVGVEDSGDVLVSRLEELAKINPAALRSFEQIFYMRDEAALEEDGSDEVEAAEVPAHVTEGAGPTGQPPPPTDVPAHYVQPSGLHAKLFVAEDGADVRLWTGSANATTAGFEANVEFLVELRGRRREVGIDAFLRKGDAKSAGFGDLLEPYRPDAEPVPADPVQVELEALVEKARRAITSLGLSVHVEAAGDSGFSLVLEAGASAGAVLDDDRLAIRCWPITLREDTHAVTPKIWSGEVARFEPVSLEAVTSFVAFDIEARSGRTSVPCRFALNLPLVGAPAGRREAIMRSFLDNPERVRRRSEPRGLQRDRRHLRGRRRRAGTDLRHRRSAVRSAAAGAGAGPGPDRRG